MLLVVEKYLVIFFVYAFLGWAMETFGGFFKTKKLVNRGFLIGPYCPVYGVGVCLLTACLSSYVDDMVVMFFMSILICGTLEYFTSYIMEKIFKARWWDYHNRKFNINGRICLETLIPFGFVGIVFVKYANTFFLKALNFSGLIYILIVLCIVFIVDFAFSLKAILGFRKITVQATNEVKDNTEEITEKVKEVVVEKYQQFKEGVELTGQKIYGNLQKAGDKLRRSVDKENRLILYLNKIVKERSKKKWSTGRLIKAFPNLQVKLRLNEKNDSNEDIEDKTDDEGASSK